LRGSASAANAWRRSFVVPVISIPGHKKENASETDLDGNKRGAKAIDTEKDGSIEILHWFGSD
jgi:hypothetical protein